MSERYSSSSRGVWSVRALQQQQQQGGWSVRACQSAAGRGGGVHVRALPPSPLLLLQVAEPGGGKKERAIVPSPTSLHTIPSLSHTMTSNSIVLSAIAT